MHRDELYDHYESCPGLEKLRKATKPDYYPVLRMPAEIYDALKDFQDKCFRGRNCGNGAGGHHVLKAHFGKWYYNDL